MFATFQPYLIYSTDYTITATMPVPLPPAPNGDIPLPQPTEDPPSLPDIGRAQQYSKHVRHNFSKLQPLINRNGSDFQIESQRPNGATQDDVIRAAVYETRVIVAHGGPAGDAGAAGKCPGHILSIMLISTQYLHGLTLHSTGLLRL